LYTQEAQTTPIYSCAIQKGTGSLGTYSYNLDYSKL